MYLALLGEEFFGLGLAGKTLAFLRIDHLVHLFTPLCREAGPLCSRFTHPAVSQVCLRPQPWALTQPELREPQESLGDKVYGSL